MGIDLNEHSRIYLAEIAGELSKRLKRPHEIGDRSIASLLSAHTYLPPYIQNISLPYISRVTKKNEQENETILETTLCVRTLKIIWTTKYRQESRILSPILSPNTAQHGYATTASHISGSILHSCI